MAKVDSNVEVILNDVRLSFEHIFRPQVPRPDKDGKIGDPSFNCAFLIEKKDKKQDGMIMDAIAESMEKMWGSNPPKIRDERKPYKDGDDYEYDGYPGHWVLSARNAKAPKVVHSKVDEDGEFIELTEADGIIYGGCRVNAIVRIWSQDSKDYGKRVNCSLEAVQFFADDDAFGGAAKADTSKFKGMEGKVKDGGDFRKGRDDRRGRDEEDDDDRGSRGRDKDDDRGSRGRGKDDDDRGSRSRSRDDDDRGSRSRGRDDERGSDRKKDEDERDTRSSRRGGSRDEDDRGSSSSRDREPSRERDRETSSRRSSEEDDDSRSARGSREREPDDRERGDDRGGSRGSRSSSRERGDDDDRGSSRGSSRSRSDDGDDKDDRRDSRSRGRDDDDRGSSPGRSSRGRDEEDDKDFV